MISLFNYFFGRVSEEDEDLSKEEFLAEELIDLEINTEGEDSNLDVVSAPIIPKNTECFQRTGVITFMSEEYVLIDGMLYFDTTSCSLNLNVQDKILYLCYKDANESVIIVRILENQGMSWGEEDDNPEESSFQIAKHTMIGEVDRRQDRIVYIKDSDLKFSLDEVQASFIPVKGDWLEMACTIQFDENKPSEISNAQVLLVASFKALRSKVKNAIVTSWSEESGVCDKDIYFDKQSLQNELSPSVGSKVVIEAIESNQGTCTWRVIKLLNIETNFGKPQNPNPPNSEDENTLDIETEKGIEMTYPIIFENVDFQDTADISITITNKSAQVHVVNKWIILGKKRDSQVNIKPLLTRPFKLHPNQTLKFQVQCCPKYVGKSKECFIVLFRGFQITRYIEIGVVNNRVKNNIKTESSLTIKNYKQKLQDMRSVLKSNNRGFVPGVKVVKPAAFIPTRLGAFTIPEKIWAAVLGDSEQTIYGSDYNKILDRLEAHLPCLVQELNINNYTDRWHTLLYMEEVQANISMRAHDIPSAYLIQCQEYLGIEINGLSEKRPSLIKGDRVIIRDAHDSDGVQYEGYIHAIKGDLVLMKFNSQFHETYLGGDVSLQFHFLRSTYRRAHQAINLAMSNLGPEIITPSRINSKPKQVNNDKLESITWYNDKLNDGQKVAVKNILLGEARPLPYCIFGPPGTGKTVTVIETILQLLAHLPDSRILVATPSNSAANLITQRLVQCRHMFSESIIRLIANYLIDSDNIPDEIRPYCATMDIAREETVKSRHVVQNGLNLNCQTSFVGRHRVTVGTCFCLGTLAQMGLPKGHFTHVIVDEAGQATEPEVMIPLTFINKDNGQIILAGDPMQLGPVIMSKYSLEYGMTESYFARILETFPYQRDYEAFHNGFNDKLVTKLNDNYRSLEEVLKLPSKMFYDGSLVAKIERNEKWVTKILDVFAKLFSSESTNGGIYVHGIRGSNARAADSPSWYNPQEASMVALTTCKLYKEDITADDIGIVTPYIAQIKYLRLLFDAMGLPQPKIGTVEEFQGQERPIILISTVRSTESLLPEDYKHCLGFVKSPKRLNVALTRAQVAVLLFCNPHLLCTDSLWNKVLSQAIQEDKYMGCDIPVSLQTLLPGTSA